MRKPEGTGLTQCVSKLPNVWLLVLRRRFWSIFVRPQAKFPWRRRIVKETGDVLGPVCCTPQQQLVLLCASQAVCIMRWVLCSSLAAACAIAAPNTRQKHGTAQNMLTLIRASGGYRQQSQTEMQCCLPACLPAYIMLTSRSY